MTTQLPPPPYVMISGAPSVPGSRSTYERAVEFIQACNAAMGLRVINFIDPMTKEPRIEFREIELHPSQEAAFRAANELVRQTMIAAYANTGFISPQATAEDRQR